MAKRNKSRKAKPRASKAEIEIGNSLLVFVAATHFEQLIYDTNDLSTVRGGGLFVLYALKNLPVYIKKQLSNYQVTAVSSGASECLIEIQHYHQLDTKAAKLLVDGLKKEVKEKIADYFSRSDCKDLFPTQQGHSALTVDLTRLTFSYGMAHTVDGVKDARLIELARASAQFRRDKRRSFVLKADEDILAEGEGITACSVDPNRFAVKHKADGKVGLSHLNMNPFCAARRAIGRQQRQVFYENLIKRAHAASADTESQKKIADCLAVLQRDDIAFADSLADIASPDSKPETGDMPAVPENLRSKIGLIYMDGNRFSKIFEAKSGNRLDLAKASGELQNLQELMLAELIGWLCDLPDMAGPERDGKHRLRIETLLWGGDEVIFVVPAWRVMDIVEKLHDITLRWQLDGGSLTFATGVLIASYKSPIRQLKNAVQNLGDAAKSGTSVSENPVFGTQIFIAEGMELPEGSLYGKRSELFGLGHLTTEELNKVCQIEKSGPYGDHETGELTNPNHFSQWRKETDRFLKSIRSSGIHALLSLALEKGLQASQQNSEFFDLIENELLRVSGKANTQRLMKYIRNQQGLYGIKETPTPKAQLVPLFTALLARDYLDPMQSIEHVTIEENSQRRGRQPDGEREDLERALCA